MFPTSASVGALLSTLLPVFALLRPARLLALLDRSDLERHRSPAAEDFFTRAFPRKVTLPASRISLHGARGRDTVTGLSPVGALPLQAARSVAKLMITACYPQIAVFFSLKRFNLWSGSETLRQWDMNLGSQRIMKMGGVVGGHSMALRHS